MRRLPLAASLLAVSLPGQGKLLYPKARFRYAYPKAELRTERHENPWFKLAVIPKGSIGELETWPVPIPASTVASFGDGPHVALVQAGDYTDFSTNFWNLYVVVSEKHGYAYKVEASHHRTGVWGTCHAWRYHEWVGAGIPEAYPVWAMYEYVHTGVESGRGVFSETKAFRVSHLRTTGAGEEFIGDIARYLGPGRDAADRSGLRFARRRIHFSVDVSLRGPKPVVTWKRGNPGGEWRTDRVHRTPHEKSWRDQVSELHASPPPAKPVESDLFCLLGSKKRGLAPAKVSTILDYKGWAGRRKQGLRPRHVLNDRKRRKLSFTPKLRTRVGFVQKRGKAFYFVCRELGVSQKLAVPADLAPLLAAWAANFPR